jgi:glycosyltransferase involved in cell wall biosynthesis
MLNRKKYKLSICIATYNRAKYLRESLLPLVKQLTPEVEIVVADGASTDDTQNVVNEFSEVNSQVNNLRLGEKGGVDCDYDLAVEAARGEYCWLLSDDDPVTDDAVRTLLLLLSHSQYSLVILNSTVVDIDLRHTLVESSLNSKEDIELDGHQLDELAHYTGKYLTFIGCVVIRRDIWLSRERVQYYGHEFIHFAVIFQKSLPDKILISNHCYMKTRYGNAQWSNRALDIWARKWPKLVWGMSTISSPVKEFLSSEKPLLSTKFLLVQRAKGNINLSMLANIQNISGAFATSKSFFICLMPVSLLRRLAIWYMSRKPNHYAISLYEFSRNNAK